MTQDIDGYLQNNLAAITLFKIQIYQVQDENNDKYQQDIVDWIKDREKKNPGVQNYGTGFTSYGLGKKILPQFPELKSFIDKSVQFVHKQIGLTGRPELQGNWGTIGRKYSYHTRHNHMPNTWSGVYYVKADVEKDAKISFYNDSVSSGWPFCPADNPQRFPYHYEAPVAVNSGKLIIFPSFLMHEVDQQMSDNERVTIAFNYCM